MGYTLKIGQLKTEIVKEGLNSYINHYVEDVKIKDAPAFGEPTDYKNARWPSYTNWHETMRFIGLEDLMINEETGLLRKHPAFVPLVLEHKEIIDKAYKEFYEKYPNAKAGYSPKLEYGEGVFEDPDWAIENSMAVRLEWLKYWVDWALANCNLPVFYNG